MPLARYLTILALVMTAASVALAYWAAPGLFQEAGAGRWAMIPALVAAAALGLARLR